MRGLKMNLIEKPLPENCYLTQLPHSKKTQIVLHFTAGSSAQSAFSEFQRRADGVSTPYIIDVNGAIWETYDETESWSYHLAPQALWPKGSQDQKTIGIEIANWGPLRLVKDILCSWPANFKNPYCSLKETSKYLKLKNAYRQELYFTKLPAAQVQATCDLVDMLCARHGITRQIPDANFIETFNPTIFQNWSGVCSHVNYRKDKTDFCFEHALPIWDMLGEMGYK